MSSGRRHETDINQSNHRFADTDLNYLLCDLQVVSPQRKRSSLLCPWTHSWDKIGKALNANNKTIKYTVHVIIVLFTFFYLAKCINFSICDSCKQQGCFLKKTILHAAVVPAECVSADTPAGICGCIRAVLFL